MDILAMSGFLNYFGKCEDVSQVNMHPILLRKGKTKLALYGIGNIRDERLNRTFRDGNVKMYRPREDANDWFNLFVIHQNR
jgi:double-strand break repair protein MRE11